MVFEEEISSGKVLKAPCLEAMDKHELTQYKLHDAIQKQNILALSDLLRLGGYNIDEQYALEVQGHNCCFFRTQTLLVRHLFWQTGDGYDLGPSSPEITQLLIAAGADVNLRTPPSQTSCQKEGVAPLFFAIPHFVYREWVQDKGPWMQSGVVVGNDPWLNMLILLDNGADTNTTTATGCTPLISACQRQQCIDSVRILLKHGARANVVDDDGQAALAIAAEEANIELIELLFHFGADPDQQCFDLDLTTTAGGLCAGDDKCAALFKAERVRLAELEYNDINDKMKVFSYGILTRVSQKTHMDGIDDFMRVICSLNFSMCGKWFVTGDCRGNVHMWDTPSGELRRGMQHESLESTYERFPF